MKLGLAGRRRIVGKNLLMVSGLQAIINPVYVVFIAQEKKVFPQEVISGATLLLPAKDRCCVATSNQKAGPSGRETQKTQRRSMKLQGKEN